MNLSGPLRLPSLFALVPSPSYFLSSLSRGPAVVSNNPQLSLNTNTTLHIRWLRSRRFSHTHFIPSPRTTLLPQDRRCYFSSPLTGRKTETGSSHLSSSTPRQYAQPKAPSVLWQGGICCCGPRGHEERGASGFDRGKRRCSNCRRNSHEVEYRARKCQARIEKL